MKSKTLTLLILGSATFAYAAITSASGGSSCCTMGAAAASLKPEAAQVQACSASAELASAKAKVAGATAAACPVMTKAKASACCAGELTSEVAKAETADCCTEGTDCCTTDADCCLTGEAEQANTASKGAQAVLASMTADTAPCCGDGGQCGDKSKKETAQATSHLPACCAGTELAQAN